MEPAHVFAIVIACIVAAIGGAAGVYTGVRYLQCHRQVEDFGLTPSYDPLTGVCTVKI